MRRHTCTTVRWLPLLVMVEWWSSTSMLGPCHLVWFQRSRHAQNHYSEDILETSAKMPVLRVLRVNRNWIQGLTPLTSLKGLPKFSVFEGCCGWLHSLPSYLEHPECRKLLFDFCNFPNHSAECNFFLCLKMQRFEYRGFFSDILVCIVFFLGILWQTVALMRLLASFVPVSCQRTIKNQDVALFDLRWKRWTAICRWWLLCEEMGHPDTCQWPWARHVLLLLQIWLVSCTKNIWQLGRRFCCCAFCTLKAQFGFPKLISCTFTLLFCKPCIIFSEVFRFKTWCHLKCLRVTLHHRSVADLRNQRDPPLASYMGHTSCVGGTQLRKFFGVGLFVGFKGQLLKDILQKTPENSKNSWSLASVKGARLQFMQLDQQK